MSTMILAGLVAAVLLAAVANLSVRKPEPPPIIYVQAAPAEPQATGCLPLIVLVLVILAALAFGQ